MFAGSGSKNEGKEVNLYILCLLCILCAWFVESIYRVRSPTSVYFHGSKLTGPPAGPKTQLLERLPKTLTKPYNLSSLGAVLLFLWPGVLLEHFGDPLGVARQS